jgi:hypothetical protein
MEAIIADVVSRTPAAIERAGAAIPKGMPAQIADKDKMLAGLSASSERLHTELAERV